MDSRTDFITVLIATWGAFIQAPVLGDTTLEMYWLGLRDLDYLDFRAACMRALKECRFFPTVAELRHLAGQQTPEGRAVMAWEVLWSSIGWLKGEKLFLFDDPVLTATIANLGGCRRILHDEHRETFLRKDFERVYVHLIGAVDPAALPPLRGIDHGRYSWCHRADARIHVAKTGLPWAVAREAVIPEQRTLGLEVQRSDS